MIDSTVEYENYSRTVPEKAFYTWRNSGMTDRKYITPLLQQESTFCCLEAVYGEKAPQRELQ
jgi:hypothetical protein